MTIPVLTVIPDPNVFTSSLSIRGTHIKYFMSWTDAAPKVRIPEKRLRCQPSRRLCPTVPPPPRSLSFLVSKRIYLSREWQFKGRLLLFEYALRNLPDTSNSSSKQFFWMNMVFSLGKTIVNTILCTSLYLYGKMESQARKWTSLHLPFT